MLHPEHPAPARETSQINIKWHKESTDNRIQGQVYTDGACTPHKIPELSRAAPGVIMMDDEGAKVATFEAPVPRRMPQTAPAAEFYAADLAYHMSQVQTTIHTDCMNVYKQCKHCQG